MLSPRTERGNRVGLGLLGVILLLGGLFCIGQTQGTWFSGSGHDLLLTGAETRWIHANDWAWVVAAVAAGVVVLACLRWLAVQARRADLGSIRLEPDPSEGQTRIRASALTGALEDELATFPEVRAARAQLTGSSTAPELRLAVTAHDSAQLTRLRQRVESEGLAHLRQALEIDELAVYLTLSVG